MDSTRAKEILTSEQQIYVTFEGDSVWIDTIDDGANTALIHSLETGAVSRVPLERLHEQ